LPSGALLVKFQISSFSQAKHPRLLRPGVFVFDSRVQEGAMGRVDSLRARVTERVVVMGGD
jgi:hypothetical protein